VCLRIGLMPGPAWAVRCGAHFVMRTDADLAWTGKRRVPCTSWRTVLPFATPIWRGRWMMFWDADRQWRDYTEYLLFVGSQSDMPS
jgi:hypothetical protein